MDEKTRDNVAENETKSVTNWVREEEWFLPLSIRKYPVMQVDGGKDEREYCIKDE